jgi:methyl-accepting chemotaxis protein
MRIRIGFQIAADVAIPIIALTIVVGAVGAGFAKLHSAEQEIMATSRFYTMARDVEYRVVLSRYAVRGYALILKKSHVALQHTAMLVAYDDLRYLADHAAAVPGSAAKVRIIDDEVRTIDRRSNNLMRMITRDPAGVMDSYHGKKTGSAKAPFYSVKSNVATGNDLDARVTSLIKDANEATQGAAAAFDALTRTLTTIMLAVGALTIVLTIGVTAYLIRGITARLQRVSTALQRMVANDFTALANALAGLANGDLRATFFAKAARIGRAGSDEIGDLAHSYDALADGMSSIEKGLGTGLVRLSELIGGVAVASKSLAIASDQTSASANQASMAVEQIAHAVDNVASGAKDQAERIARATAAVEQIARTAEQIAVGAGDQAASIQRATDSIKTLDSGIEKLTGHSTALISSTQEASGEAKAGTDAVAETQVAMHQLRDVSGRAASAIAALEDRSLEVGKIVRTIEEIADQTNLLALNAAIEAARAGEQGRGFAVVADEVRKLAERSSLATKEIGDILNAIRRETVAASNAMRTSDQSMEMGLTVAERAGISLLSLGAAIAATTGVADDLAGKAQEMRSASGYVTENMSSTSIAVEENAAAASQMKLTTQEVTSAMFPVATTAEENAAAAREAANATNELAAGVQEIDATARALRDQAERLDALVAQFTIDSVADAATNADAGEQSLKALAPPERRAMATRPWSRLAA